MALSDPGLEILVNSPEAVENAHFTALIYKKYNPVPDNNVETATGTCIDTIQGFKNEKPNRDVWGRAISEACWTAKQSFSDRFDNASDQAVETIAALPPTQQEGAAALFSYGMGIVRKITNQASDGILDIDTKELLAGNWNKLTEVDNDVKAGCSAARDALNSMF
ncbi:hypothetical protein J7337_013019 [Fusarium musae]|uniref:Uncharacterized protein n=1 Tax=Fusarium musae TaxID=1042133 RepID=A0A9P8IHY4_9HYPO|nr:hypothetical protein J7337_013019 [Fusarium musae]KAG9496431.1 hypothetical protein J7337_013019 [Fusarium musae]